MGLNGKFALGTIALALLGAQSAQAAVFDFTITSANGNASGQFTATDTGTYFLVTAVSGTVNGLAITGLANYGGPDNELFPGTSSLVDRSGVAFTDGTNLYSIFRQNPGLSPVVYGFCASPVEPYCVNAEADRAPSATFTLTAASAVPEPAGWALTIGGFGLIGAAARRRKAVVSFG